MSNDPRTGTTTNGHACAVSVEVVGRQRYLLETDRLREMLGASLLMDALRAVALAECRKRDGVQLFGFVSGEVKLWASHNDRNALLDAAWRLREWLDSHGIEHAVAFAGALPRAAFAEARGGTASLREVHRALARARNDQLAIARADAQPSCALFAPCRVHGHEPATVWRTDRDKDTRRELISARADAKRRAWENSKAQHHHDLLFAPVANRLRKLATLEEVELEELRRAVTFTDLTDRNPEDQYVAFLFGDGDGLGQLISSVPWNAPRHEDGASTGAPPAGAPTRAGQAAEPTCEQWWEAPPWQRDWYFADALDKATRGAFGDALAELLVPDVNAAEGLLAQIRAGDPVHLPLLPLLIGGDDLWALAERQIALPFARLFAAAFETLVKSSGPLTAAMEAAGAESGEPPSLSMSVGVAFAKAGFPAYSMQNAAKALLKSAKSLRKGHEWGRVARQEACVDWYWIQSSQIGNVMQARDNEWHLQDGDTTYCLTTLPWTAADAGCFEEAARELRDRVPRGDLKALYKQLQRGNALSDLAWEAFMGGLRETQRDAVYRANARLPEEYRLPVGALHETPWRVREARAAQDQPADVRTTPWLDLVHLLEIMAGQGATSGQEVAA